ncbi:glutamate decarboxylase [Solirubrobacter ginsenosidimutans]|uniref:Glutamate decarboxylase n=1 Tax=Solirubrobacter ginsenosidimutans TaxID=490573 RepID=A0A9X3S6R1_9ACTN|nr:glutamate decarboxylase [Solirubrobacter ginsenosidimutans]MDA0167102.1 glutamate decarboxylase [Solirubrobacter ginsenosidimutans]
MPLHRATPDTDLPLTIRPQLARPGAESTVPRLRLPDGELPADAAYQLVHDELLLDGQARLNLATFVTTWMEPHARKLMDECLDKNMIDKDEYPQTAELERRCVNILASLWGAEHEDGATGCSTTGSSEACMLGGLALKWRWRERRRAAGLSAERPNLVMGANVQVCWEKFCRYWDVEPRLVPVSADVPHLTAAAAVEHCDEHTIGVVAVLGSTYDGSFEPVAEIAAALDQLQATSGLDVQIHVDAASGGFVAPFLDPELVWDFRLPRVQSINSSGHKYGLVYPGVGWAVWRDKAALPEDLIFEVDYLGGRMPTFALNFSRGGAPVVAQYYELIRLGREGFRRVQQESRDTATWLAGEIATLEPFRLLSDGSELPVFAFALRPDVAGYTVYDVSEALRFRGWIVPAYPMPPAIEDLAVLRVCVRNGFSHDLASLLLDDLRHAVSKVEALAGHLPVPTADTRAGFHH